MSEQVEYARAATAESRARHWSFTLNHPTAQDDAYLLLLQEEVEYLVYQLECGENGTPHYQGCMGFKAQRRFAGVKKLIPRSHLSVTRNVSAALEYCQKLDTRIGDAPVIYGTLPHATQGRRSDLEETFDDISGGMSIAQAAQEHASTFARYGRGILHTIHLQSEPRSAPTRVFVFHGPSGSGKTRTALERFETPYKTLAFARKGTAWFDGYEPEYHQTVVVDDFYGQLAWSQLLQMCDRYAHRVETKGGMVNFKPKTIIFTSNSPIHDWYKKMNLQPFIRRLREFGGYLYFPAVDEQPLLELDADGQAIGQIPAELNAVATPDNADLVRASDSTTTNLQDTQMSE